LISLILECFEGKTLVLIVKLRKWVLQVLPLLFDLLEFIQRDRFKEQKLKPSGELIKDAQKEKTVLQLVSLKAKIVW
jgi:hypothetical protein